MIKQPPTTGAEGDGDAPQKLTEYPSHRRRRRLRDNSQGQLGRQLTEPDLNQLPVKAA